MNYLIFFGLVLLGITWWDYRKEQIDSAFLFEWAPFDVSRASFPRLFWTIIAAQIVGGVILIISGLKSG